MGQFRNANQMFPGVKYRTFENSIVKQKMTEKLVAVKVKITERQGRISRLLSENKISASEFADILVQYMKDQERGKAQQFYSTRSLSNGPSDPERSSGRNEEGGITAGTIANLVAERELIESEQEEVKRMALIVRNLMDFEYYKRPDNGQIDQRAQYHELSDDDMLYLGL